MSCKSIKRLVYVIGSQGEFPFGRCRLQPWIENVNKILVLRGFNIHVFTAGSSIVHYIRHNVRVLVSKRLKFFRDPFSLDIPFRLLLYQKPDLAIIHGLRHTLTLATLLVLFIRKIPTIIIAHGLYEGMKLNLLAQLRDILLKILIRSAKFPYVIISLTEHDKHILLKHWMVPKDRVVVAKCFLYINEDEFKMIQRIKEYYTNRLERVHLLYIGRLSPEKRVDILIRVLYRLIKSGFLARYPIRLLIAGDGPLKKQIIDLIKRLKLEEYVIFLGPIYGAKKWLAYLSSIALVIPSKSEGLPRTIYEAFATGNIVIASNICGLPEVIRNGVNGFLYNNEEELLEILRYVISNKEKILEMGLRNQELTRKKLILEHNTKELLQIINDLLRCAK